MISMIRPAPQEYALKSAFGFSIEKLPSEGIPADFFQELPERFTAAELPFYQVENPVQLDGISPIHACALIESGLLDNLSLQFPGLVRDCITGINRNIETLAKKGITSGVLDLDLNSILSSDRERLFLTILRGLANTLERYSFQLLIPFSIPSASPEIIRQVSVFLKRTLLPWVKLRLDIHAHELRPGFSVEELADGLFPEIRSIRFVYLADTGNVLIPEHIIPWLKALGAYGFRGPCFFVPMASALNGLASWVETNETLIGKMEQNLEK